MTTPIIHSVFVDLDNSVWRVTGDQPGEQLGTFAAKEEALNVARAEAKKCRGQLVVRKANQIVEFAEDFASVER